MNTRKTRLNILEFSLRFKVENSLFYFAQIFVAFLFAKNNVVFADIARSATNKANYIINS